MILQIDGEHIPIQEKNQRSFEALFATIYQPENIERIDQHHRKITEKSCAVSAISDELQTMKTYMLNAALKQGMTEQTSITALADGAKNCWSVALSLKPFCQEVTCILDWFHIGQKYPTLKNALGVDLEEEVESSKWSLWHGKVDQSLNKLEQLQKRVTDPKHLSKLKGLYDFIKRNQAYVVNYQQRKESQQIFTSQTAAFHVESVINARHKRSGKMQWSRESAHNVLQIRSKLASNEWENQ